MAEGLRSKSSKEAIAVRSGSPLSNLEDGFLSGVTPEVDATSGAGEHGQDSEDSEDGTILTSNSSEKRVRVNLTLQRPDRLNKEDTLDLNALRAKKARWVNYWQSAGGSEDLASAVLEDAALDAYNFVLEVGADILGKDELMVLNASFVIGLIEERLKAKTPQPPLAHLRELRDKKGTLKLSTSGSQYKGFDSVVKDLFSKLQMVAKLFGSAFKEIGESKELAEAFLEMFEDPEFREMLKARIKRKNTSGDVRSIYNVFHLFRTAHEVIHEASVVDGELADGLKMLINVLLRKGQPKAAEAPKGGKGSQGKSQAGEATSTKIATSRTNPCFHCGVEDKDHNFVECGKRTDHTTAEKDAGAAAKREVWKKRRAAVAQKAQDKKS